MIRLAFTPTFTLGGIVRSPQIDVVTGQVTANTKDRAVLIRSKGEMVTVKKNTKETFQGPPAEVKVTPKPAPPPPPSPTPSPLPPIVVAIPLPSASPEAPSAQYLAVIRPRDRTPISVAKGSQKAEAPVALEWKVKPENIEMFLKIFKKSNTEKDNKPLFEGPIRSRRGLGQYLFKATEPGQYEWSIASSNEKIEPAKLRKNSSFTVLPRYQALSILEPLVGGKPLTTNMIRGKRIKQFKITLRWEPYPGVKKYKVNLLANADSTQALQTREVSSPEYELNKDKVYSGRIFYKVDAELKSGFIVSADPEPFVFNFLPPLLVMPKAQESFSVAALRTKKSQVIFTWQKTNFTDAYLFQIASDPEFKTLLVSQKLPENFYVLKRLVPATYYWRVQAFSLTFSSAMSPPNEFILRP